MNVQHCHKCGAESGTIWWAIVFKEENTITGEVPVSASLPEMLAGSYLDSQQRYQLLESLPNLAEIEVNTEVRVRVLDCQPYQVSPLTVMLAQLPGVGTIPSKAKPYIALQPQQNLGIPLIHDAWQQNNLQIVLIEDRSNWLHFVDLLREDTITSLHIIHCFYQITQLWAVLESVNCRQSLLELPNLRLDEDQSLALQELYEERSNQPEFTLQTLGRIWQTLLRQSERTQFGSIVQLLADLEMDKVESLVDLQSRLSAIAVELQASSTPVSVATPNEPLTTTAPTILQLDDVEDSIPRSDDMPTVVLPMQLISLEDAGLTDVGRQRNHNEDYFGIETQVNKLELPKSRGVAARGLYILCDGMGGHAGGEVASELAVNTLRQYFDTHWSSEQLPSEDVIREGVRVANQAIFDVNQQDARSGVGRMGTTLVMVLVQDSQVIVAHVGDSRLYRLTRKGGLEQVTVDHEVGQREILRGVEAGIAYSRPDAYQLTQALGPRDEKSIHPDVEFFEISEDTLFILASDGLSDNDLLETHWQSTVEPLLSSNGNLERGVRDLIDLANKHNGHDNITAVLIRAKVRPMLDQVRV
jgi:protein phosphatase